MKSRRNASSLTRIMAIVLMLVMVMAAVPSFAAAFDNSTTIADGTYEADSMEGGSSKVKFSCHGITVSGGKATAEIHMTSSKITKVTVGDDETEYPVELVTPEEGDQYVKVTIPVKLNEEFAVTATSTAMGGSVTTYTVKINVTVPGGTEPGGDTPGGEQPGGDTPVNNQVNSGELVELAPGNYDAVDPEAITEGNKMFRGVKATLKVNEDGSAVLDLYLSGTGYNALYNGPKMVNMPTGAIGSGNPNNLWTDEDLSLSEAVMYQEGDVDGESKYHFVLTFDKLYSWILIGGHSGNYNQWSHKTLNFSADNFKLAEEPSSPSTGMDLLPNYWIAIVLSFAMLVAFYLEERRYHE